MSGPWCLSWGPPARGPMSEPVLVDADGRLLPPIKDTRAGSFSCCADCASRELSRLCCLECPRSRTQGSLLPRLAVRGD